MTAIKLERGLIAFSLSVQHKAGKRLDDSGRQYIGQFCQMCTPCHAAQALSHRTLETLHQVETFKLRVGIAVVVALATVGHSQRLRPGVVDVELGVDHQPQEQVMDGLTSGQHALAATNFARLGVAQSGINLPQTVGTREHLHLNGAGVLKHALGVRGWQRHEVRLSRCWDQRP